MSLPCHSPSSTTSSASSDISPKSVEEIADEVLAHLRGDVNNALNLMLVLAEKRPEMFGAGMHADFAAYIDRSQVPGFKRL